MFSYKIDDNVGDRYQVRNCCNLGEAGNRLPIWQVGPALAFIASINDSGGTINKEIS